MADLREVRRLRVTFVRAVAEVPKLDGLKHCLTQGNQLTLEYAGPLAPLLEWLAREQTQDLHIEPIGLAAIYHRFHGNDA
jgi:hypothetical protein